MRSISSKFWYFTNVSLFPRIYSLKFFGNSWSKWYAMFLDYISATGLLAVNPSFSKMLQISKILSPWLYVTRKKRHSIIHV